ncbi:MAG: hypothetical protein FWD68_08780 [Alphaproteobacteria bacterium]|nr:hypothetical protein [Alphaproteobacteria bacterium]
MRLILIGAILAPEDPVEPAAFSDIFDDVLFSAGDDGAGPAEHHVAEHHGRPDLIHNFDRARIRAPRLDADDFVKERMKARLLWKAQTERLMEAPESFRRNRRPRIVAAGGAPGLETQKQDRRHPPGCVQPAEIFMIRRPVRALREFRKPRAFFEVPLRPRLQHIGIGVAAIVFE